MTLLEINTSVEGLYHYDISSLFNCETDGTEVNVSIFPGANSVNQAIGNIILTCAKNAVTESMIIALNNAIINGSAAPGGIINFKEVTGVQPEQVRIQAPSSIPQIS